MSTTICFFNINNLFLRYKWGEGYPGSFARGKSSSNWGFVPAYDKNLFHLFSPKKTQLCADALKAEGLPDILCLCEVEGLLALRSFNEDYLNNFYKYAYLIDSRDYRQIDVAILSNRKIQNIRSHVDDTDKDGKYIFSRDCLEVDVELENKKNLFLFINHLKSKFVNTIEKSDKKIEKELFEANKLRQKQAEYVSEILSNKFTGKSYRSENFLVLGDFNDQPESEFVAPLVKNSNLFDCLTSLPEEERWTFWWKSRNRASQIDYMLLSPALAKRLQKENIKPRIERRGLGFRELGATDNLLPKKTKIFRKDTDPDPLRIPFDFERFPKVVEYDQYASDHCPVFLELPV
jgi:endonuclease/exonuclease/phosphatase family metal-dependent hydrolase